MSKNQQGAMAMLFGVVFNKANKTIFYSSYKTKEHWNLKPNGFNKSSSFFVVIFWSYASCLQNLTNSCWQFGFKLFARRYRNLGDKKDLETPSNKTLQYEWDELLLNRKWKMNLNLRILNTVQEENIL